MSGFPSSTLHSNTLTGDTTVTGTLRIKKDATIDPRAYPGYDPIAADNSVPLLAALADVPVDGGTVLLTPTGQADSGGSQAMWLTSQQIIIPNKTILVGFGRDFGGIKAAATFPVGTPLVRLGPAGRQYSSGIRLENCTIDCSDIVDSDGVYSTSIQETAGCRDVLIRNLHRYGIHIAEADSGVPLNWDFKDIEVTYDGSDVTTGAIGMFFDGINNLSGQSIDNVTVNANAGAHGKTLAAGIAMRGMHCKGGAFHFEGCNIGLELGGTNPQNAATFSLRGISGHATTAILIQIDNTSTAVVTLIGLEARNSPTLINDLANGLSSTEIYMALYLSGYGVIAQRSLLTSSQTLRSRLNGLDLNVADAASQPVTIFTFGGTEVARLRRGGSTTDLVFDISNGHILNFGNSAGTGAIAINCPLTISDTKNISTSTNTGTKFPALSTQKLGLWGVAPVAQQTRAGQLVDNSGGASGGNTIAVIGGAVDPTAATVVSTANAIATLAARLNTVEAIVHITGLSA